MFYKKGSAIAYALSMMFIASIIFTSLLYYITAQIKFSYNRAEKEEAFQVAEAGIYYFRWYLAHQTSGKTAQQIQDFWENGSPFGVGSAYEADYEGIGMFSLETDPPEEGSTIVIVRSTGWTYKQPGVQRTVQVRFRRPSWSEFMFMSDSFMNFGTEAEVFGKVHSNDGIRFDGLAHNTVSSLLPRFDDPTHNGGMDFGVHTHVSLADPVAPSYPWADGTVPERTDVFEGGRDFPVPEVSFTGVTSDLAAMKSAAQGGNGIYFNDSGYGRDIVLSSDGTFNTCTVNSYSSSTYAIRNYLGVVTYATGSYASTNGNSCTTSSCCSGTSCPYIQSSLHARGRCVTRTTEDIPDNGVLFVEDNIWLQGTVSDRNVSIVAANLSGGGSQADIYLNDSNLRTTAYDCDNRIGLVGQRDILVVNSVPNNYTIDAAALAQTGKVAIDDSISGKGLLTFNGAIVSYLQPYFRSGSNGFSSRVYNFDNNLLYCPPPYFPTGTEYAIDLWDEL